MPETKRKSLPQDTSGFLLNVINSMTEYSAQVEKDKKINKQKLKNTYETLLTVKKCLADCGLLLQEINKRSEYTFYNFVLVDKTKPKRETFWDYLTTRKQLDEYVNTQNEGNSMRIKGKFWEFSPKTDITITATKFKNEEEIKLYKKLKGIRDDKAFSKCDMCLDITVQLISSKIIHKNANSLKSINDLIKSSKIKAALELQLKKTELLPYDKNYFIQLLSRLNKLETDKGIGIVTDSEYRTVYNQITDALIQKREALKT
jgi:uncharacterized protein YktA (UPF0223 family)